MAELVKMTFGKYRDELITRVPPGYLFWMLQQANIPQQDDARAELDRRGTTIPDRIEISNHALDRFSTRGGIQLWWKDQRDENEGLYSFLYRLAAEAIETEPVKLSWGDHKGDSGIKYATYAHQGYRFVVADTWLVPTLLTVFQDNSDTYDDGGGMPIDGKDARLMAPYG